MDVSTLRRLAAEGFEAVPPPELPTLAAWCDDWAVATGEARFSVISDALRTIAEEWGEQGIPGSLVERIEGLLKDYLPEALDAEDARDGAYFANELRRSIRDLPWTLAEWEDEGWARARSVARPSTERAES